MRKERKIPTIIGLIVLVFGVAVGVFLIQTRQTFKLSASPEETPQDVRITNITHNSFTVSWITQKRTRGYVSYGKGQDLGLSADEGDTLKNVHYAQIGGLDAKSTYYFKVGSNDELFDNSGELYRVQTASTINATPKNDVVYGKLLRASGEASPGSVVYITIAGVSPLSTLTDNKGEWVVNLGNGRNSSLTSYAAYGLNAIVEILAQGGVNSMSTARIQANAAKPVPPMTLGKNHNFSDLKAPGSTSLPSSNIELAASEVSPSPPAASSPTPTPRPTATLTPTPKPVGGSSTSPTPTPRPTSTPTPTLTPTPKPTKTPTPTKKAATLSALPEAGDLTPLGGAFIMGLSMFVIGIVLPKAFRLI